MILFAIKAVLLQWNGILIMRDSQENFVKNWHVDNMNDSKKTIVLNRLYAGRYLSTHLGHEVINMFQADNGKHYLYLNANNWERKREPQEM